LSREINYTVSKVEEVVYSILEFREKHWIFIKVEGGKLDFFPLRIKELHIPFLRNPVARSSIPVCSDHLKGLDAQSQVKKRRRMHSELSFFFSSISVCYRDWI
jgi:hypothetical protein